MSSRSNLLAACIIISMLILACSIDLGGEKLDEEEKVQTAIAQTMEANLQLGQDEQPEADINTPHPTITLPPPAPPTPKPKPCNAAEFVSETVPDGTELALNQTFTKTWRFKNVGTCTWNTNYELAFSEGKKMGGPSSKKLTQMVAPGEMVDFSVDLKVPGTEGTYTGYWKVNDDQGITFVQKIWVEIVAKAALPIQPLFTLAPLPLKPFITLIPIQP